ncbi:hypothetical protein [Nostoc sp. ChiQUE01b]|uniref:hypothetical protein n=1 Tax=Nostoc sp. ChiQUE01b TaxID=3075376 RepID=UPI002AD3A49F|nr:hypothetical protein [Nostoc sp. ChiQUE01b]MDZ8264393.1 hypothetical protein [Nostoc sp. ChiQUE01b]
MNNCISTNDALPPHPPTPPTPCQQRGFKFQLFLVPFGRVTMRGIARWTGERSSYRTMGRFFFIFLTWALFNSSNNKVGHFLLFSVGLLL